MHHNFIPFCIIYIIYNHAWLIFWIIYRVLKMKSVWQINECKKINHCALFLWNRITSINPWLLKNVSWIFLLKFNLATKKLIYSVSPDGILHSHKLFCWRFFEKTLFFLKHFAYPRKMRAIFKCVIKYTGCSKIFNVKFSFIAFIFCLQIKRNQCYATKYTSGWWCILCCLVYNF